GLSKDADVSCENIVLSESGAEFDVVFSKSTIKRYGIDLSGGWKKFTSGMYGEHNVQNALAAICAGLELGISEENMRVALGSFMGVKRRFTKVAEIDGVKIIDDYAHHPVEISAVLKAARNSCRGKIYAVIQPHRYTRLHNFLPDFGKALQLSDYAIVTPIYSAGEVSNGVDHFSLLKCLDEIHGVPSDFAQDVETLKEKLKDKIKSGDLIVFLGAGDITQWAYKLADMLISERKN
ncbi:MAG: UDP-N-acetylmuramate--L-alanine ligase, partial [Alphaproteobacteria bacterium]|nr:UDP-N-acetylmuramate--L-alanine ligase [Alphaproteobacteria bacterium]